MSGADAAAPAPAPGPTPASPANAAIITKLKDQVGFYFSARNLQQDTFLYSKMDRLLRVPLEVVADFHRVKDLRATQDQLLQAARESSNLIVHEEGGRVLVSPAHIKPALRTTLILREVPEDVTEDEIKALFAEAPVSVKTEVGSNRFVEFATEEQTIVMHRAVINKKLRDSYVKARVKNELIGLNMLVAKHEAADRYMQSGADAANDPFGSYADAGPPPIPLMPGFPPASPFGPYGGVPGLPPHPNMPPAMPMWYEGKGFPQYGKGAAGGGRRGGGGGRGSSGVVKQHPYQATPPHAPAAPAFTPEDFPTLVKQDGVYDREVIRWGKTDIIKILAGFAKEVRSGARSFAELGVDLPSSDVCPAVLEKPNFDIELTKPVAAAPGAGPSFADAVKRGGKKPVPAKKAPAPASTPAAAPAAAATSAAAPTPAAAAAATAPAAEPKAADKAEGGEEAPVSPGGRKSWVEAAIHAGDVKVAAPTHHTVQYRAGYASAQAEKEETPATGKKGGRGGGKGGKASKGGRGDGSGRGGGKRGGKKGDGEGKGARKGSKKGDKGERPAGDDEEAPAPAAAAAAVAAPAAEKPATTPSAAPDKNSWAAVAMGLSSKAAKKTAAA